MKCLKVVQFALAICLLSAAVFGQRNLSVGNPVIENFDGLGTNDVNVTPNTTPIVGFYYFRTNSNVFPFVFAASSGNAGTGQFYNFGSSISDTDRAAGTVSTNTSGAIYLGMRIRNTGSVPITRLRVQYRGEQWRKGNGSAESLTFDYRVAPTITDLTSGTYTAVPGLTFTSPFSTGGPATNVDGDVNASSLDQTISVNIPVNEEIMLRWVDVVSSAQGDGFGIDDLAVTAIGPTAAGVTVSGRVTDAYGRAISNARIMSTDMNGVSKYVYTNTFGYYSVPDLLAGQSYIFSVYARRYTFADATRVVDLTDNLSGVDFIANR